MVLLSSAGNCMCVLAGWQGRLWKDYFVILWNQDGNMWRGLGASVILLSLKRELDTPWALHSMFPGGFLSAGCVGKDTAKWVCSRIGLKEAWPLSTIPKWALNQQTYSLSFQQTSNLPAPIRLKNMEGSIFWVKRANFQPFFNCDKEQSICSTGRREDRARGMWLSNQKQPLNIRCRPKD